jgi:hypothetical protein
MNNQTRLFLRIIELQDGKCAACEREFTDYYLGDDSRYTPVMDFGGQCGQVTGVLCKTCFKTIGRDGWGLNKPNFTKIEQYLCNWRHHATNTEKLWDEIQEQYPHEGETT